MILQQQILDKSLVLAHQNGWERMTLHDVAAELSVPLAEIHHHFSQKDDLVEAWFDRADQALLNHVPDAEWQRRPAVERIEAAILRWLGSLAEYRELTGEMLLYKLEPGHIHLQVAGVLRISRTVQWFREAAGLRASGGFRVAQEVTLSSIYVTTFVHWLRDGSEGQRDTLAMLRRKLEAGDRLGLWL